MGWLKVDDNFNQHAKVMQLPRNDRWTWLEVLLFCSRNRSATVPANIRDVVPHARKPFLDRCRTAGLLDLDDEGVDSVHDWNVYNGQTIEERVQAYLDSHPEATANEVCRIVGGNRKLVLNLVEEHHASLNGTSPRLVA